MDFILKKKQFRFDVSLKVEELSLVPFVNAVLYCKLRFIGNGKRLIGQTPGLELQDHRVVWNKKFTFPCKMTANSTTMELDATCCRISIRRELKGGRAHHKIGFVDLNLSEYVGSGSVSRRFLLEGYHSSNRLDNSILKLSIGLTLVSGDVCFKVPKSQNLTTLHSTSAQDDSIAITTTTPNNNSSSSTTTKVQFKDGAQLLSEHYFSSNNSNEGTGNRSSNQILMNSSSSYHLLDELSMMSSDSHQQNQQQQRRLLLQPPSATAFNNNNNSNDLNISLSSSLLTASSSTMSSSATTKRLSFLNNNNNSDNILTAAAAASTAATTSNINSSMQLGDSLSQSSTSSTLLQSRSNSENAINKTCINRNSGGYSFASMPRPNIPGKERRVELSRIDANQLVDEVIRSSDLNFDAHSQAGKGGLQLFVKKDGTAVLGSMPP